jgi:hypothetical protein
VRITRRRARDPGSSGAHARCADGHRRGVPEQIIIHPACRAELAALAQRDQREAVALRHARRKLVQLGSSLGYPHTSAIRGSADGMRELRPRAGNSPWRLLYLPGRPTLLLALAPEAMRDRRGFRRALDAAHQRRFDQESGPC